MFAKGKPLKVRGTLMERCSAVMMNWKFVSIFVAGKYCSYKLSMQFAELEIVVIYVSSKHSPQWLCSSVSNWDKEEYEEVLNTWQT